MSTPEIRNGEPASVQGQLVIQACRIEVGDGRGTSALGLPQRLKVMSIHATDMRGNPLGLTIVVPLQEKIAEQVAGLLRGVLPAPERVKPTA